MRDREFPLRLAGTAEAAGGRSFGSACRSGRPGSAFRPGRSHGRSSSVPRPRSKSTAAAIAELVLWIGYLQWHIRTRGGLPSEPILRAFRNVKGNVDAILTADQVLARDETGKPLLREDREGGLHEVYLYKNPRPTRWPEADFIVGNPPSLRGNIFVRSLAIITPRRFGGYSPIFPAARIWSCSGGTTRLACSHESTVRSVGSAS